MEFMQAKSAREALEALLKARGQAALLAGGTDLMVNIQEGKAHPQVMIDVNTAADMKGIRLEGEELVIGAAATLSEIDQ
jgi:CO/xanthine dehydrogenase FAD-binding subunit